MTQDGAPPPSLRSLEITCSSFVIARALYAFAKLGISNAGFKLVRVVPTTEPARSRSRSAVVSAGLYNLERYTFPFEPTEMALSLRPALVSDAADIARLTMQLGYECEAPAIAARLSRLLSRSDQRFVVAEWDGDVVAWMHAMVSECVEVEPFVVIGGLVVDRGHRRKGIGRALMHHAEEWARATGGCAVVRLSSSVGRTAAHAFYERLGYTRIKTQYSFVKSLVDDGSENLSRFVPRVDV